MKNIVLNEAFPLECGKEITNLQIAYETYGALNADRSNVIWVNHALTGSQYVHEWWGDLFGEGNVLDPTKYFIVAVNALGSCYGTTGPATPSENRRPQLLDFPKITIRDQVNLNEIVRKKLDLTKIHTVIGASFGGQIALEWSVQKPDLFENLVLIATNARHSAFGIAFNESQRLALELDPTFGAEVTGGKNGLIAARSIAMLSYRSYRGYNSKLTADSSQREDLPAISYQRYQGVKLAKRFNAYSYYYLSQVMDSHDIGKGRGGLLNALSMIRAEVLTIGVNSDLLFPTSEQLFIMKHVANGNYAEIKSDFGHDGFLVETDQLSYILKEFLVDQSKRYKQTTFKQLQTVNN